MEEIRNVHNILFGEPKGRCLLEDQGVDEGVILKLINKQDWKGVERLHVVRGTAGGGCGEQGNETSNSINMGNVFSSFETTRRAPVSSKVNLTPHRRHCAKL